MGAIFAIIRIQREKPQGHAECRHYECPKCGRYHLTSMSEGDYEKIKEGEADEVR